MSAEFDDIPVRLPSGKKALIRLPRPFTEADTKYLARFLDLYVEEPEAAPPQSTAQTAQEE